MNPFSFLFWPAGTIGRGGWWLGQVIILLILILLIACCFKVVGIANGTRTLAEMTQYTATMKKATPEERRVEGAAINKRIQANANFYSFLFLALLLVLLYLWCSICVEAKRWHDMDQSGLLYLTLFIPSFAKIISPEAFVLVCAAVSLVRFIFLGFVPGYGAAATKPIREAPSTSTRTAPAARPAKEPSSSGGAWLGWIVLLIAFVLALWFKLIPMPDKWLAELSSLKLPALPALPASTNSAVAPATTVIGTTSTDFGKDWVTVNGQKLTGITAVLVVAGQKVDIIYSGGGKGVAAGDLPQGFLALWKITPESLRAADQH